MKPELRVHIAVLGYLSDRIYLPAINQKADKVYLLRYKNEKDSNSLKALSDVRKKLKKEKIELKERDCEIFNLVVVVKEIKKIALEESQNNLYLNISSGNTLSANAIVLSAMMLKNKVRSIQLYYVPYDYRKMEADMRRIDTVPVFQIKTPNDEQNKVIELLNKHKDGLRKSQILEKSISNYKSLKREDKSKRLMSLNRRVIDKLTTEWDMIRIEGKRKNAIVKLKHQGELYAQFI